MAQYRQLIHEYLDGTLPTVGEDMLFAELSRDTSLRREFQEQMALHRGAAGDMATIATPADLSAELFAKLGIPAGPVPEGIAPISSSAANRPFGMLSSVIVGLVGIIILYFVFSQPEESDRGSQTKPIQVQKLNPESTQQESFKAGNTKEQILHPHISLSESDLNQTSLSINQSQENIQAGKNFKTSPLSLYGSEPNTDFKKEQVVVESTISHNPHIEVPVQIHSSWIMQAAFSSMAALQNTAFSEEQVYITSSVLAKENPFALQLHGASADFKNANLTFLALYDVSAADRFGLEAGRENFIQNFSQSVNGQTIRTTQLVPVTTLGVVYQRSLSGIISSDWLVPFAQGYLGSSAEGVILTKLSTGANIRVTGSFILMLGAEAAYAPLSKQYNSRYQLVAGAGMQF